MPSTFNTSSRETSTPYISLIATRIDEGSFPPRDNIGIARYIAGMDPQPEPEFEQILSVLNIGQRLDHNHSTAIRGYGSYSQLALLHPAAVLAQALFPPEGGNINPSRFGLSPPTGYNLFTLQAVEFTASRQHAAAETAN